MKIFLRAKVMLLSLVAVLTLSVGLALAYYTTEHNHGGHRHNSWFNCINGDNYLEYEVYDHIYAHTYNDNGTFISEGLAREEFVGYESEFYSNGPCY